MGAGSRQRILMCAGIVVVTVPAIALLQDEPAPAAGIFVVAGLAAAYAVRRPVAWLVPLIAAVLVAVIDQIGVEVETDLGEIMPLVWLAAAAPGMVAAALVGALLRGA